MCVIFLHTDFFAKSFLNCGCGFTKHRFPSHENMFKLCITTLGHNWPIKSKNKRKINFGNQYFNKYIHPEWWDGPAVLFNWMFFPFLAHGVFYWKVEEKNQNDIALIQSSPHTQKSSSDNKD